jgi:hypothetical protein
VDFDLFARVGRRGVDFGGSSGSSRGSGCKNKLDLLLRGLIARILLRLKRTRPVARGGVRRLPSSRTASVFARVRSDPYP